MRICIYEDRRVADLHPLTLTRPASDLLCGLTSLAEKQSRHFAAEVAGHLVRPVMAELLRARHAAMPVNEPSWLRSGPTILVNSRWLPPPRSLRALAPSFQSLFASGPFLATCNGETAYALLDTRRLQAVSPDTLDDCLDDWSQSLPRREVGGNLIRYPWELIDHNPSQIGHDFDATCDPTDAGFHPSGILLVGHGDGLFVHPSAKIDPLVVTDTTHGPVWIGPNAEITAFSRLEGPCVIGAGTHLFGAKIRAGTTIGPNCRIGGEVECSIVQGHANKYHDGFLGHSFVGEWVNLAAGTSTSDLRCDYREIRVLVNGVETPTGRTKVGSFIGDHARTGLNVMLNCGSVIGPFATLFPTGQYAPREVPAFARFGPNGLNENIDAERLVQTASIVMKRRGQDLMPAIEAVYRSIADVRSSGHSPTIPMRKSA